MRPILRMFSTDFQRNMGYTGPIAAINCGTFELQGAMILVYVFFAHGFEEIEAITAVNILRRAHLEVRSVGVGSKTITGSHGITVHCDMIDHMAGVKGVDMIVLPGGMPGTINLEKSDTVCTFIDHAVQNNLWIAAICAAPSILGHRGVLQGKRATCFTGFEQELEGAEYLQDSIVQDGKLITASGPQAAVDFALKLVECLLGEERAQILRASL